jgi:hypothetical protein
MLGLLRARLPEAKLHGVKDPRRAQGQRWPLESLLAALVVGVAAGCKSLLDLEALTYEMAPAARRKLKLKRRVPDTTLRDTVVKLAPMDLRRCLHAQTKAAHRRKALAPFGLPFGVLAMDGKSSTATEADDHYAQRQQHSEGDGESGLVRTITCCLVSSAARVCIDAISVPAQTNEMGHFSAALNSVHRTYGKAGLFRLVSYDAGACSAENAAAVIDKRLHYLFSLKETQPTLLGEARRLLGRLKSNDALATSTDVESTDRFVTRRLYLTEEMAGFMDFPGLNVVLRVESETRDAALNLLAHEDRYRICSLPASALSADQWLLCVRRHWAVENNCHHTWDKAFREDDHPWIRAHPRGMVVMMLIRRIAYNMLALFRSVTQRSEDKRGTPWRDLLRWVYQALLSASDDDVAGLRQRSAHQAASS